MLKGLQKAFVSLEEVETLQGKEKMREVFHITNGEFLVFEPGFRFPDL